MSDIGVIPMPSNFRYIETFRKGRPRHEKLDPFWQRHPNMDPLKRAKIFAPFDALRGFSAAVIAKNEIYEYRRELSDEELEELSHKLSLLQQLTANSQLARENQVQVTVTYFVPCADRDNEAYGYRGRHETISGTVWKVDPLITRTIQIDDRYIPIENVLQIA